MEAKDKQAVAFAIAVLSELEPIVDQQRMREEYEHALAGLRAIIKEDLRQMELGRLDAKGDEG